MKTKLLLFAFTLIGTMLFSQSSVPRAFEAWKTKDGTPTLYVKNITKTDASGNVYTAGATLNPNGTYDIFLVKKNSSGVTLYTKQINGTANTHDFIAGMVLNGTDVYVTGTITNNTLTLVPELFVAKFNSSGTQQFLSTYSGGYGDAGKDLVVNTTYSACIVTGATYNSGFTSDMVVVSFNMYSGAQNWVNGYDHPYSSNDAGIKIATKGSNCTVTSAVTVGTNQYKLVTTSYTVSTGSGTGTLTAGAVATSSVEIVTDITQDASGNIYICGATQQNAGQGYDYYIAKITNSLTIVWEQTYNGSNLDDFAKGIDVDASGQVWVTGVTTHSTQGKNITTLRLNSSGVIQSTLTVNGTYNGNDEGADVVVDASSNAYVASYQTLSSTNSDFYTVKYNSSGTKIWEKFTDGYSGNDQATNIALDSLNCVVVAGSSELSATSLVYLTTKLVQADITNPVDLYGQASNKNIGFHTNRGQIRDEDANSTTVPLYYTHNLNPEIFIEKGAYDYVYLAVDTVASTNDSIERISVTFSLSSSSSRPYGYDEKGYPLHYFLGDVGDPITNVRGYDRVVTQDLYPHIDLHYFSNSNGFKYYFVVKEGGDPRDIKLKIDGATTTTITSNNLLIDGVLGDITLKRPYAYMVNGAGATTTLSAASWSQISSNYYEISAPTYTTSQTLIIVVENMPPASVTSTQANLDYSTYYGGNGTDYFRDIRVAANGDRAVCGQSSGGTFPTNTVFQSSPFAVGAIDAVLLKYTADDTLRYCTYYGASGPDWANSVAINSTGHIFIAGFTQSSDLLITNNAGETNQAFNGNNGTSSTNKTDGFIIKFKLDGSYIDYGRYVGGSRSEYINSIYIDGSNNLYFTGTTSSDDLPVVNAYSNTHGTTSSDDFDMLIGKMNSAQVVSWLTYFGGNAITGFQTQEYGNDITVDNSGNVFVIGESDESSFPTMNPAPTNTNVLYDASTNGYGDGAIVRLTSSGTPNYATFVGGNYGDRLTRTVYDPSTGDLYFAGNCASNYGMPLKQKTGSYYDGSRHANPAALIGYMNSSLEHQWITYYGRGGASKSYGVGGLSLDNTGVLYLSGQVYSDSLEFYTPTPSGAYVDNTWASSDGFVAIFGTKKGLEHAHYFGGSSNDYIYNADVNGSTYLYVVGNTGSTNFPIAYTSSNASLIDSTFNGSSDGFISRFNLGVYNIVSVKENAIVANNVVAFPNPANNFVTLKINTELKEKVMLKVYNTVGQIIHEESINGNEKTIDCNKWASGMYIFTLSNKEFNSSFKIIKE